MLTIKPLTFEAIESVLADLSPEDAAELLASGSDPVVAFTEGFQKSVISGAAYFGDMPVAIFGCVPDPNHEGVGVPWMVCTPELRKHPRAVMAWSRRFLQDMAIRFNGLHNLVHREHAFSIRWLRWLGFHVEPKSVGPSDAFHYFYRGKNNV